MASIGGGESHRYAEQVVLQPKSLVPSAVRRRVGPTLRSLREPGDVTRGALLSAWRRELPELLVIGAAKSGTSSMFFALKQHPMFAAPCTKEINYFDIEFYRGRPWYRAHFPVRAQEGMVSGDASPGYLWDPRAPRRAAELLPGAKIVALLREPIARAFSHHQHNSRRDSEPLSFEEAVDQEDARTADGLARMRADEGHVSHAARVYSYVGRSRYAEQLDRWAACFPRERMLVLRSEDFYAHPASVFRQVTDFVGIPHHEGIQFEHRNPGGYTDGLTAGARARLADLLAPHNERLARSYGAHLVWP
jgi:hypothetical protein